jgi:hypothetical protein
MENEQAAPKKSKPVIIEGAGMQIAVDYRRGGRGDAGLTFDVTVAGEKDAGKRILRFDCFDKTPHYHVGPGRNNVHDMRDEGIEDPVRWTLEQLKTRLPTMVKEAGYEDIAEGIDQKAIALSLSQVEKDILAKI